MMSDVPSYAIVIGVVFAILVAIVYFLPAMVANNRRHADAIKLLNLGLGWTGVGWVGALIWAMLSPKETLQEGNSLRGNAQGGLEATQVPPLSRSEASPILWRQVFGLILASLVLLFLSRNGPWGFLTVPTGVFTFCDAWHAGIYKKKGMRSLLNISPMGWAIAMGGLLIVAYPFYLFNRNKLKTKPGSKALWILTNTFGALTLALAALALAALWIAARLTGVRSP